VIRNVGIVTSAITKKLSHRPRGTRQSPDHKACRRTRIAHDCRAIELISNSDFLDWQGNGFMDLAEVCRLRGDTAGALDALAHAADRFEAKGNIVSAALAAAELRALAGQPGVRGAR
jgi:hypothetical protein